MKKHLISAFFSALLLPCILAGCATKPSTPPVGTAENTNTTEATDATEATTPEEVTVGETGGADTSEEVTAPEADTSDTAEESTDSQPETEPSPEEVTSGDNTEQPSDEPKEAAWPKVRILFNSQPVGRAAVRAGEDITEQYAGRELQKYLEKMSIPMQEDGGFVFNVRINPELADDGYRITTGDTAEDGVTIEGGNGRGVIYGVYAFLEQKAKVRFFTPELETCGTKFIQLNPGLLIEYTPVFENRHTDWFSVKTNADWLVKNGMNCSIYTTIHEEMGSMWSYGTQFVHNISTVTNTPRDQQPCLTDEKNLEYAIQYVRKRLENEPGVNIITVSQMDHQNYCRCANCAAVDAEEGSPAGTLLRFVNAIARDIAEDYPDVVIDTLAYQYTRKAPSVTRPEPNVCIRLCSIECCWMHPLSDTTCEVNVAFMRDLLEWNEICDRIYIWDYTANFSYYIPTYPNFNVLRDNMRFFADHGVKGMFPEGNYSSPSGEFGELRAYLLAKLMVDPYMTAETYYRHMDEFLKAYYGDGWMYIRAYIDYVGGEAAASHSSIRSTPFELVSKEKYKAMEETLNSWWDKAEELAGDRLAYVRRSRLQWRYIQLMLHPNEEVAKAFVADVEAAGVYWNEWRTTKLPDQANLTLPPDHWDWDY